MYERPISQLGIRQTFILVAIFGYFTIMIVLVIPVVFIFTATEGWTAVEGRFSRTLVSNTGNRGILLDNYAHHDWLWRLYAKLQY